MLLRGTIVALAGLALGALTGLALLAVNANVTTIAPRQISVGKAQIGGPFQLIDHTGKSRTDQDFRGKHMLVFFGFLHCPDICPAALQIVSEVLERLGEKQQRLVPLFITVDPERDTPKQLAAYLSHFSPRIIGLTGSPDQIKAAATAYRAYYKRVPVSEDPSNYTMDHSTIIYLMGPDGRYVMHFTHATSAITMANRLQNMLKSP